MESVPVFAAGSQRVASELLSNLVYGVNESSGFPADPSLIDTVDKPDPSDDIGELLEAA